MVCPVTFCPCPCDILPCFVYVTFYLCGILSVACCPGTFCSRKIFSGGILSMAFSNCVILPSVVLPLWHFVFVALCLCSDLSVWDFVWVAFCPVTFCLCGFLTVWRFIQWRFVCEILSDGVLSCGVKSASVVGSLFSYKFFLHHQLRHGAIIVLGNEPISWADIMSVNWGNDQEWYTKYDLVKFTQ